MKLISFDTRGNASWGALRGDEVIDLGARWPDLPTLRSVIEAGALDRIGAALDENLATTRVLGDVSLLPVIPEPGQILCIGLNYDEHRAESRREKTAFPTVFARYGRSQVAHGATILRPPESVTLDYEGELALVIGKGGRRIAQADAMEHVAGYACYNDASIREFQKHSTQFHPGKNFAATGAFGPYLVTADEIPDPSILSIETRLNGQVVQSGSLDQLIFTIPELIAYCSTFTELLPGDVIVTGTPGGVGMARTPPLWMRDGDLIEIIIPGVGHLANPVADEVIAN